jgi:hypothetical protein
VQHASFKEKCSRSKCLQRRGENIKFMTMKQRLIIDYSRLCLEGITTPAITMETIRVRDELA